MRCKGLSGTALQPHQQTQSTWQLSQKKQGWQRSLQRSSSTQKATMRSPLTHNPDLALPQVSAELPAMALCKAAALDGVYSATGMTFSMAAYKLDPQWCPSHSDVVQLWLACQACLWLKHAFWRHKAAIASILLLLFLTWWVMQAAPQAGGLLMLIPAGLRYITAGCLTL